MRSDDDEVLAALARLLPTHHRPGTPAYANLSVRRGATAGPVRGVHLLFRGGRQVVRSTSLGRVLRATIAYLDSFLPAPDGLLGVQGRAVVDDTGAVIVTRAFEESIDVAGRRLARDGWRIVDGPDALVDRESLELVVPPLRLDVDAAALLRLGEAHPLGAEELGVRGLRRPVRGLVALDMIEDENDSPARRFSRLTEFVARAHEPMRATDLETLARLQGSARVVRSSWLDERDLPRTLRTLAP